MQPHGKFLSLMIRYYICFCRIQTAKQASGLVLMPHSSTHDIHHGCLGAIGDELDCIVELAKGCGGVYGARMTGGGFGGCAIILAKSTSAESITTAVLSGFSERFARACSIFPTIAAAGGGPIE